MMDASNIALPQAYPRLASIATEIGFSMQTDFLVGTLLKTLVMSKPQSNILEIGTGMGLSLSWMIEGMDAESRLTSIDNDAALISKVKEVVGDIDRMNIICADGGEWLQGYNGEQFDLIFADAWPGKYSDIERALDLVREGGFYVVDDMLPQPDWPEEHALKAQTLISYLEERKDFSMTKLSWSSGVIILTKATDKVRNTIIYNKKIQGMKCADV